MKNKKIMLGAIIMGLILCGISTIIYAVYIGWIIPNKIYLNKENIIGCDVSHYQGDINWDLLYDQNVSFVFIKATEGSGHIDKKFLENWDSVYKSNIKAGAYHFFSFDSHGKSQAERFISLVQKRSDMLPPVIDVEFYGDNNVVRPDPTIVRKELNDFISAIEIEYETKPILYTTKEAYDYFLKDYYNEYPLWIRGILTKPNIDREWTFWQYTNREKLEGYSGVEDYIDMNVFNGNKEDFHKLLINYD